MRAASRLLGVRVEVGGLEHIASGERYVVVALHEGFADALALAQLPLQLTYLARDELADWRFVGGQLRHGGHLVMSPEGPWVEARAVVSKARAALERGDSVVVFPQGSILGLEIAFQRGAFALAQLLDCPLLPVVVTGSHRVWDHPFSPRLRFGQRVSVRVLPPVPAIEALSRRDEIEAAMKRVARGAGMAAPRRFDPRLDGFWDGYRYEVDAAFPAIAELVAAHRRRRADGVLARRAVIGDAAPSMRAGEGGVFAPIQASGGRGAEGTAGGESWRDRDSRDAGGR